MSETKQVEYPLNRVVASLDVDAVEDVLAAISAVVADSKKSS